MEQIKLSDFQKIDIRSGTVIKAEFFAEARKPAIKMWIDFGSDIGVKTSSAQITDNYRAETLVNKPVQAVVNLEPIKIAGFLSEVLVTGFISPNNHVILAAPDQPVPNGLRLA